MIKVMDLVYNGKHYTCKKETSERGMYNAYRLYLEWNEPTDHGIRHRTKQIAKYAEMRSVLSHIVQLG